MLRIGLTGGIGSGKTTIAKIFSTLGIPVYDADFAAKNLMETNEEIKQQLVAYFGDAIYANGRLNRALLATLVFSDAEKLKLLNAITHPATIQDSINWFNKQLAAYALKEAALIFESGSEKYLDYVIGVWAPLHKRIERTLQRGGITEQEVKGRMKKQMSDEEKMQRCDFVIDNSGEKPVIKQVYELHEKLSSIEKSIY